MTFANQPRSGQKSVSIVDAEIGRRIERVRKEKHISQGELAQKLNVSFQQIQKYEKGASRISAGRLIEVIEILGVDLSQFCQGLGAMAKQSSR